MPIVRKLRELRFHPSSPPDREFIRGWAGPETHSGIAVDADVALSSTAMLDGVRMIAQDVGRVPLNVYRRLKPRGKEIASEHRLQNVLHTVFNPEQNAMEGREMVTAFAVLCGTGFAQIITDGGGRVREMWPITPHRVKAVRAPDGTLYWMVRYPDRMDAVPVPADEMFVLRGFGVGGVLGLDIVDKMREAIGMSLALEAFGASFFGNGSHPGGVVQVPEVLSDKAYAHLKESLEQRHRGIKNAHRVAIIEEGSTWVQTGVPPEAAQFLESRKFQVTEVARALNIPPHKLKDLERATFSNIEHQAIDYVTGSLGPWYDRWEYAGNMWLLTEKERAELFIAHIREGLLKGDIQTRYNAYSVARQNGWMSVNDVRDKEDMNPVDGGDDYHVQSNLVRVQDLEEVTKAKAAPKPEPAPTPNPEPDNNPPVRTRERQRRAWERQFTETARRAVTREIGGVRTALRKGNGGRDAVTFRTEMDEFYAKHEGWLVEAFEPLFRAFAEAIDGDVDPDGECPAAVEVFARDYTVQFARGEVARALGQIKDELRRNPGNPDAVGAVLTEWEAGRPEEIAERESRYTMNAFALASQQARAA